MPLRGTPDGRNSTTGYLANGNGTGRLRGSERAKKKESKCLIEFNLAQNLDRARQLKQREWCGTMKNYPNSCQDWIVGGRMHRGVVREGKKDWLSFPTSNWRQLGGLLWIIEQSMSINWEETNNTEARDNHIRQLHSDGGPISVCEDIQKHDWPWGASKHSWFEFRE